MRKLFTILILGLTMVAYAQPTVNGDLSDVQYTTIATKQNSNAGFGSNIDVSAIVYYADVTNSVLYLGVTGKLDVSTNNEIGIFLNVAGSGSPTGILAGNSLSVNNSSAGYIGDSGNPNYKADFEVDYMFGFNPGGGSSNIYFDAGKLVGGSTDYYQGACDQSGTSATNSNANGTVFSNNSITFAFNNGGGANQGLEMSIPFSEIGASASTSFEIFTFVVSFTGYFSDVTVPGNITTGNPGYNADFSTLSGGVFHSGNQALPVELSSFTAIVAQNEVQLNWKTATEVNNYGFEVERSIDNQNFETLAFVEGHGNSNSVKSYSYADNKVADGKYYYRLKQINSDGTFEYSETISAVVGIAETYSLLQNYPNPFNPTTTIQFNLPENSVVSLKVFNALGQQVADLANGLFEAGIHKINFNASELNSGIYFYQIKTNDFTQVRKMMLVK